MTPEDSFDFTEWTRRLDSGDRSEPMLDLAARIQELSPKIDGPAPVFQEDLRARLIDRFPRQRARRILPLRRIVVWGLVSLAVLVIALIGLLRSPGNVSEVSAAEILEFAGQRLADRLEAGDLVYDRLILDWKKGGFKEQDVVAELWRSADGAHLRYQMYDGERLLYFDQHDSQHLWRSSYIRPVEGRDVDFVYRSDYAPDHDYLDDRQLAAQLLFRDLGNFWIYIDQMAGSERSDCADLFCVLSSIGQGWNCAQGECTLNLGPIFEPQDLIIVADGAKKGWLSNGTEVYQVRLHIQGIDSDFYQNLKFDSSSFDLLEIEDFRRAKLHYRIRLVERETLDWAQLPPDFFQSTPDGIEVRSWPSEQPLGRPEDDAIWIISADPPPDANLSGVVMANLELGYRLTSVEQATIYVRRIDWVGHDWASPLQVEDIPITAGEGTVRVSFTFDSEQLGDGEWVITPQFADSMGIAPHTAWGHSPSRGIYLKWCIRCLQETPAP
jgi:hypothetical protein